MTDGIAILLFFVVYYIVLRWIAPKAGIHT